MCKPNIIFLHEADRPKGSLAIASERVAQAVPEGACHIAGSAEGDAFIEALKIKPRSAAGFWQLTPATEAD
ncbi:hypothetical protein [Citrobacter freundii]|uniref:hypothetical protein n=1 Tax=Citrobacter freundii TaxID=546 RepID=UPI001BCD8146|nr:hypothetical protein [Citrobacter freundii]